MPYFPLITSPNPPNLGRSILLLGLRRMNSSASGHPIIKLQLRSHGRLGRCGANTGFGVWRPVFVVRQVKRKRSGSKAGGTTGHLASQKHFETLAQNGSKDGSLPPQTFHDQKHHNLKWDTETKWMTKTWRYPKLPPIKDFKVAFS